MKTERTLGSVGYIKMEEKIKDGIYCCGEQLLGEDGVNDSLFFKCEKCGKCYNIIYSEEEID